MIPILILSASLPLLLGLLFFEKRGSTRGLLLTKPFLSALFVATALSSPGGPPQYFTLILSGLILCMAGDIFLIFFSSRKLFLAGLVSFLAGHVFYTIAFFSLAAPGSGRWIVTATVLSVSIVTFAWLRPHLGRMLIPVFAYIAIITAMVIGAAALADTETVRLPGRALAFSGALLFYVSDLFVARQRFVTGNFFNRAVGLPLYFVGQFMIAFSIRLV